MAAFIFTAWFTVLVAAVNAFHPTLVSWYKFLNWYERKYKGKEGSASPAPSKWNRASQTLLDSLCDLQVITGTAILVAGLAQIRSITFYHEQFVSSYWWLTLNSFWAARGGSNQPEGKKWELRRLLLRTLAILFSVILSLVFQGLITLREHYEWNILRSGYCYLSHDHSAYGQSWLWEAGLVLYALGLCLALPRSIRDWLDFGPSLGGALSELALKCVGRWQDFCATRFSASGVWSYLGTISAIINLMIKLTVSLLYTTGLLIFWCFIQFLAVWSYGEGFYAVEVLIYVGFVAWNTFDLIDLKISNSSLVIGSENAWGFGQVLPMVLLAMIIFNLFDAVKSVH